MTIAGTWNWKYENVSQRVELVQKTWVLLKLLLITSEIFCFLLILHLMVGTGGNTFKDQDYIMNKLVYRYASIAMHPWDCFVILCPRRFHCQGTGDYHTSVQGSISLYFRYPRKTRVSNYVNILLLKSWLKLLISCFHYQFPPFFLFFF